MDWRYTVPSNMFSPPPRLECVIRGVVLLVVLWAVMS